MYMEDALPQIEAFFRKIFDLCMELIENQTTSFFPNLQMVSEIFYK